MFIYLLAIVVVSLAILVYIWWRFFFFFRDPERVIPEGNNIVSPADGTVVYIKNISKGEVPLAIKRRRNIKLNEIFDLLPEDIDKWTLVGIYMHLTSVHVNRAPISGKIEKIHYRKSKNLPMTIMSLRVFLKWKPFEWKSRHIITNERNTILIKGSIPVFMTQIADLYVNRIVCFTKENQNVLKGDRIGIIKFGSQVDLLIPNTTNVKIAVKEGEKVFAGKTIIADIT